MPSYVSKSFSGSYVHNFDALQNQPMNQKAQDEYIEKIRDLMYDERELEMERERFFRLSRVVVDLYSMFYRDILQTQLPPAQCATAAAKIKILKMDQQLIARNVPSTGSYRNCDITLMYIFLRNACPSLPAPVAGWGKQVPHTAVGIADDIERIRQIRNTAFSHISSTPLSVTELQHCAQTARDICKRMDCSHAALINKSISGKYEDELDRMLHEVLDTELSQFCVKELARAAQYETKLIDKFKECVEIEKSTHKKVTRLVNVQTEIQRDIKEMSNIGTNMHRDILQSAELVHNTQRDVTNFGRKVENDVKNISKLGLETQSTVFGIETKVTRIGKLVEDTYRKVTENEDRNEDKKLSELQRDLGKIHNDTLQNVPLNPLQKKTRIPFDAFSAPLKIREDLSFKTYKAEKKREYKDVNTPSDLLSIKGKNVEYVYLLGEPGRGKTGQCYQLVHYWLESRKAEMESKEPSDWQKGFIYYDLLFLVTLRHVAKGCHSVVDMICQSVLKRFPQHHETVRQFLKGSQRKVKCLIVLDGLDEMEGEPDIDVDMTRCTVFMTTRPWKFHYLSPEIYVRDKVVEVCGLNEDGIHQVISKVLVNYFEIDVSTETFKTKFREMCKRAKDAKYKSIMEIPLVLTASVHLLQSNSYNEGSMTSFLASLVNRLVKIAFDNHRVTCDLQPITTKSSDFSNLALINGKHTILRHFGVMLALGRVAYRYPKQIVFGKESLEAELGDAIEFENKDSEHYCGKSVLQFALEVGLLTQTSAPGSGDEENVSINFFHKTVGEYLAALYIASSKKVIIDGFLGTCIDVDGLIELSNVLKFLIGLDPSLSSVVSKHIAQSADNDSDILKYRQMFDKVDIETESTVMLLFKTVCDCYQEMKYSRRQLNTRNTEFHVSDVYEGMLSDTSTGTSTTELLSQHGNSVVSLHMSFLFGSVSVPFPDIKEFLEKASSLKALHLEGKVEEMRPETTLPSLCTDVFLSLTVLSLSYITLDSHTAHALQVAIQCNTELRVLRLNKIAIRGSESFVQDICVNLNNSPDLRILNIENFTRIEARMFAIENNTELIKIEHSIWLLKIERSTPLIKLVLYGLHIQSVDALQFMISHLTQLQVLDLGKLSFTDDNYHNISINLTRCSALQVLSVSDIFVDKMEINPCNLRELKMRDVSGSVQDLLFSLSDGLHLEELTLHSVTDSETWYMILNLKKCENLRKMDLRKINIGNLDVSPKSLQELVVEEVSGSLQCLFSSLSDCLKLRELTLHAVPQYETREILFYRKKGENLKDIMLNLKKCENLRKIRLSEVHFNTFDIITPQALDTLTIRKMSVSMQSLLLSLPQYGQLRYLFIIPPFYKTDVKVLIDVLPQLTQLEHLTYWGDYMMRRDTHSIEMCSGMDHARVVQAMTVMPGLESLEIENVDMGNLAITLAQQMTKIRHLLLVSVNMTASSWCEFLTSLFRIEHGFDIELWCTNIDDESMSAVHSSPHLNVTRDEKGCLSDGLPSMFKFSKLDLC